MTIGTDHQTNSEMVIIKKKKYAFGLRNEVEYGVIFTISISIQICRDSNLTPKHWNN